MKGLDVKIFDDLKDVFKMMVGEILTVEMHDNMKKELCIDTVYQLKQKYGNLQG